MSKIVETNVRQARFLDQFLETCLQIALVQWDRKSRWKDKIILLPTISPGNPFDIEPIYLFFEFLDCTGAQNYCL